MRESSRRKFDKISASSLAGCRSRLLLPLRTNSSLRLPVSHSWLAWRSRNAMTFRGSGALWTATRTRFSVQHCQSCKCPTASCSKWRSRRPIVWPDRGAVKHSHRFPTYMNRRCIVTRSLWRYPKGSTQSSTVARRLVHNSGGTKSHKIQPISRLPASPNIRRSTEMASFPGVDFGPLPTLHPKYTMHSSQRGTFTVDPYRAGCFPFDRKRGSGTSTHRETGHAWSKPIRKWPLGHTLDGNYLVQTNILLTPKC